MLEAVKLSNDLSAYERDDCNEQNPSFLYGATFSGRAAADAAALRWLCC
jgi:hypothetical protein